MIRPITCVGFLLACGSGLYLYQAKHRVNVIDQQIQKVVHQTDATREQIRLLHAEWTLLNQPDRLQKLASQFLTLQPTNPSQFTSMKELDSRLPPIPLPPETPPAPPSATDTTTQSVPVAAADQPPLPAAPPQSPAKPDPAAAKSPEPPKPKPVDHPHPVAEPKHPAPSAVLAAIPHTSRHYAVPDHLSRSAGEVAARSVAGESTHRTYWQRPYPAPAYSPAPAVGSMLGMARQAALPPPAPIPVAARGDR
jgi:hypothetical protein